MKILTSISIILSLTACTFLLASCATKPAGAETDVCSETVLMPGDYPDPSVVRDGDDYYMTHSPMFYHRGFLIWHSRDLMNWTPLCRINLGQEDSVWAPDFIKYGDMFYIYYPTSDGRIFVITSKDVRGPWSEPRQIEIGFYGIDPGHIADADGNRYIFTSGGMLTPLTPDGLSVAGASSRVYDGWDIPEDWIVEGKYLESPKLIYKDGYFYMTSAEGGTAGPPTSHMCVMARSKSIEGPWENSPYNPLIHTYSDTETWWSKGHGTLFEDADGRWWMAYHAYPNGFHSLGRWTLLDEMEYTEDGWFKLKGNSVLPKKVSSAKSWLCDDFSARELGLQWAFWKEYSEPFVSVGDGILSVEAKGSTPADARLLTLITEHQSYETQVITDVKDDSEAGLLLFYDEENFAGVTVGKDGLKVYKDGKNGTAVENTFGTKPHLRLTNNSNTLSVLASADGEVWQTVADGIEVSGMHHNNLGGFLSLRIALMSAGQGKTSFYDFKYKGIIRE